MEEEQRNMQEPPVNTTSSLKIVGINLAVFFIYTVIGIASMGEDGGFSAMILAVIHAFICVIIAIIARRWVWVLSALLLIVIGFATCVSTFSLNV